MLSKDDQSLIDLALSQKMITQAQADEAAKAYETVAQLGLRLTLMEILREKGFLTLAQQRQLIQGLYQKGVRARVGGYEIMTRIGKGGMGTVYKARQLTMNRVVALKILRRRLASDKRYIERFQREARALAKLNHENIVQGIDVGEADGYHYFAMEFIEGTSIKETILNEGALDESLALGIALQMARALRFAHQNGIIHRDMKPSNIILTKDGVAKLCDLGLAKLTEAQEDTSVTQPGDPVGTALYISPEQARGETSIDARADIYSLGATLYHMAVGEVPFQGATRASTMTKHITEPLPPPKERNLALSDNTCAIIEKMMAKDRKDRYANCDEMIQDLQLAINDQPPVHAAAHLPAKPHPKPTVGALRRWHERARVAQRPTRRESFVLGAVAAILVVGGFVLFFGVGREFAPTEHETPAAMNEGAVEPESARAMLDYAQTFAAKNPRLYKDIIGKLEMIPAVAPDSPQALKARKLISEFRKRLDVEAQKAFDALKKECDDTAASDRFQAAIEVWQKFPSRCDIPEWRKKLDAEVAALRQAATAKFKDYEARALALAEQGQFDAAKAAYKDAESLGTKEV
ncbi:MAG: serine/threonine protein kinase, partial [Planctomycetes bacterium]|nr:serine/threonine protein kinase [Planctomycetota bacterium]